MRKVIIVEITGFYLTSLYHFVSSFKDAIKGVRHSGLWNQIYLKTRTVVQAASEVAV